MVVWSDDLEIFNKSKDKDNDSFSEIENALDIFLKILQLVFREISCVQFMYFLILFYFLTLIKQKVTK